MYHKRGPGAITINNPKKLVEKIWDKAIENGKGRTQYVEEILGMSKGTPYLWLNKPVVDISSKIYNKLKENGINLDTLINK